MKANFVLLIATLSMPAAAQVEFGGTGIGDTQERAFFFAARRANNLCLRNGGDPGIGRQEQLELQSRYNENTRATTVEWFAEVQVPCVIPEIDTEAM